MQHTKRDPDGYLRELGQRIGARAMVVASREGLLVAGSGDSRLALEELAAYAPSQLPAKVTRPAGLTTRRIDLDGDRLYVGALDAEAPPEALADLARLLG